MGRIHWCGGLPPERTVSQGGLRAIAAALSALGCVAPCSSSLQLLLPATLRGRRNHSIPLSLTGRSAGRRRSPNNNVSPRGDKSRPPDRFPQSVSRSSYTRAGRGVSQVPGSPFFTSEPSEDGTDCAAVAVTLPWEFGHDPAAAGVAPRRMPGTRKGASTTSRMAGSIGQEAAIPGPKPGPRPAGVRTPSLFQSAVSPTEEAGDANI